MKFLNEVSSIFGEVVYINLFKSGFGLLLECNLKGFGSGALFPFPAGHGSDSGS